MCPTEGARGPRTTHRVGRAGGSADRRGALGDADAVLVAETAQANAPEAACAQVMTEALDGDVSVNARTAVHRADLPGYDHRLADLPLLADAVRHIDVRGERAGTAVLR